MDDGALDYALKTGRRLGIFIITGDQVRQFIVDIIGHGLTKRIQIDIARAHHSRRIGIVDQCQQQVLERRIFMMALVGKSQCLMQRLFEAGRKCWHVSSSFLFHDALQRVLMLPGEIHHLRHLGFGDLVGEDAAFSNAVVVDM